MEPGERIKELRLKKGLKQKPFAQSIEYSDAYLSEIERGVSKPSRDFLIKIYEVYGIPENFILHGKDDPSLLVKEGEPEWILTPNSERRLPENAPKREFIGHVIKILESGNRKAIKALKSNVEAFLEMVETKEPKLEGGD